MCARHGVLLGIWETLTLRDRKAFQRCRCASAIRARPALVLGPVDIPPWNRQRRFPGITLMTHGAPARVLAQQLGRNLRFKGSPRRVQVSLRSNGDEDRRPGADGPFLISKAMREMLVPVTLSLKKHSSAGPV